MLAGIEYRTDVNTMEQVAAKLAMNDIAKVTSSLRNRSSLIRTQAIAAPAPSS